ncbi:NAD(P)-binding protein [Streptomyces griseoincarnatus]
MPCSAHSLPSERVVILGAGPCGLACADELKRLGHPAWTLLEAAGGLGSSVVDPAGFTWDLGGHVVFSHFGEFDRLLAELFTAGELLHHARSSYTRFRDRWVPCPFQQHLHHFPGRGRRGVCARPFARLPAARTAAARRRGLRHLAARNVRIEPGGAVLRPGRHLQRRPGHSPAALYPKRPPRPGCAGSSRTSVSTPARTSSAIVRPAWPSRRR